MAWRTAIALPAHLGRIPTRMGGMHYETTIEDKPGNLQGKRILGATKEGGICGVL